MATGGKQFDNDEVDGHVLKLMTQVIRVAHGESEHDQVGRALLFLLVRVANTWRSIRTLRNNTPDAEGFTVDAGTLLRAMFDAYIQAAYIVHEPHNATQHAQDYLDFEYVERFKLATSVMQHDTPLSRHLKASPKRPEGETRLHEDYDRVKCRYFLERKRPDGTVKHGPATRNTWYAQNLAELAKLLGTEDEYDSLL